MVKLESVWFIAAFTKSGLNYFSFFDESTLFSLALFTDKGSFLHFWNDIGATNNDTSQGD